MQVSVESTGKLEREMRVEIPEERIANEVQNRLKSLSRTTKIQGFRPGKAPFKVVQQRYGKQVRQEVIGEVVQSTFYEAITQEKLRPAGHPHIHPQDSEQGLVYTAKFEIMPDVALGKIEELEFEKPVCDIGASDIDNMIEVMRKQRKDWKETDRKSQSGDTLVLDFEGTVDGEPFEGNSAEDYRLELGSGRLIEGFEAGLLGKEPGEEVVLDLAFPGEYQKQELAGKPVQFKVKIHKVLEPVLPDLNDEFFASFGVKDGGIEAFKKEVSEYMKREAESVIRNRTRDALMNALYEANQIEVPKSLVQEEAHRMQHQFNDQLKAYGMDVEKTQMPDNTQMFEEQAGKRVAIQLIVMEIIRSQDLKADPNRVRAFIEQQAQNYADPSAMINWYYADKQRLAEVEARVLEDQVIDWVSEKARIKEANVTFDELVNKGQTDAG